MVNVSVIVLIAEMPLQRRVIVWIPESGAGGTCWSARPWKVSSSGTFLPPAALFGSEPSAALLVTFQPKPWTDGLSDESAKPRPTMRPWMWVAPGLHAWGVSTFAAVVLKPEGGVIVSVPVAAFAAGAPTTSMPLVTSKAVTAATRLMNGLMIICVIPLSEWMVWAARFDSATQLP